MKNEPEFQRLLDDPSTPWWVMNLIDAIVKRDPVDVANALEVLSRAANRRCARLLESDGNACMGCGLPFDYMLLDRDGYCASCAAAADRRNEEALRDPAIGLERGLQRD